MSKAATTYGLLLRGPMTDLMCKGAIQSGIFVLDTETRVGLLASQEERAVGYARHEASKGINERLACALITAGQELSRFGLPACMHTTATRVIIHHSLYHLIMLFVVKFGLTECVHVL